MGLPSEQNAAVRSGEGHEAKAPVQRVPVPQEPGPGIFKLTPGNLHQDLTV
jgi:hypothetical protein